jgi:glycosyltransferase involved in cell wall biosynthesis
MKYVIILLARNEEKFIELTLRSVVNQSICPLLCLVINDNSIDKTQQIVKKFENDYEYIKILNLTNDSTYQLGCRIVDIFNLGLEYIRVNQMECNYIIKLDGDTEFNSSFIETILFKAANEKFGIVSGTPYYTSKNKLVYEFSPYWHTHGQFKIYDVNCINDIGGLKRMFGWDCADNIQAIEKGWRTQAFRDIYYYMHRPVGGKISLAKGKINQGIGAYNLGYSKLYLFFKITHDIFKGPIFFGVYYYLKGYFKTARRIKQPLLSKVQVKLLRQLYWNSFSEGFIHRRYIVFQYCKIKNRIWFHFL